MKESRARPPLARLSPPMILDEVEVRSVERLSPSYVRVELGGPALADFGVEGSPLYDQRIKLVIPGPSGRPPPIAATDASWYRTWAALPEDQRGHVRTYTVRAVRGAGADTRLVLDLVLHLSEGATGPGSRWAAQARAGLHRRQAAFMGYWRQGVSMRS